MTGPSTVLDTGAIVSYISADFGSGFVYYFDGQEDFTTWADGTFDEGLGQPTRLYSTFEFKLIFSAGSPNRLVSMPVPCQSDSDCGARTHRCDAYCAVGGYCTYTKSCTGGLVCANTSGTCVDQNTPPSSPVFASPSTGAPSNPLTPSAPTSTPTPVASGTEALQAGFAAAAAIAILAVWL